MVSIIILIKVTANISKNYVNRNEYFNKFKIKTMKQLLVSIAIAMVFTSFHSYTIYELRNILQTDPPPKDKDQWRTNTPNQCSKTDPPPKNGGQW
ncbi:Uncharacterised protein [Chryseobacterium nakagawai]|uniref:Uncharacterized protein n=2 Tax=Chryseobacterium nakagawai TaxID=1241982 RepID=A0AAD1DPZ6_CHRNA|nr:hypothetical protein [Chryseobacterium nakagawai]AZA90186.1 hypothetical protein EG343_05925 [Chryseobacterium nakagawai]VEH21650.1 Uncharacterised protein [Chryseobacterium nakagawai]